MRSVPNVFFPDKVEVVTVGGSLYSGDAPDVDRVWKVVEDNQDLIPTKCSVILCTTQRDDENAPSIFFGHPNDPFCQKSRLVISVSIFRADPYAWFRKAKIKSPNDDDWTEFERVFSAWYLPALKKSWLHVGKKVFENILEIPEPTLFNSLEEYQPRVGFRFGFHYLCGPRRLDVPKKLKKRGSVRRRTP